LSSTLCTVNKPLKVFALSVITSLYGLGPVFGGVSPPGGFDWLAAAGAWVFLSWALIAVKKTLVKIEKIKLDPTHAH
jgi:hypothetical protein